MEASFLTKLGKIAGVGGLSIGAFVLIFRDVLSQKFLLPEAGLTQQQAFSVLMTLLVLTFGIAVVGLVCWLIGRGAANKPVPNSSMALLSSLILAVLGCAAFVGSQGQPGLAAPTQSTSSPNSASMIQFLTEQQAQQHCPNDMVVWLNLPTGIYHFPGQTWYGRTKSGAYVCQKEADKAGNRATHNGQ